MSWQVGMVANAVIAIAYFLITLAIVVPLTRSNQLRSNPLGAATAAIFFTCAVHHGTHSAHMLLPSFGIEMLVIVGAANAVNLTDGLDGLAIMPVMIAAATFGAIAYVVGNIVDAGFLPTSAAVNPALTIAAQALRVADHMIHTEFRT